MKYKPEEYSISDTGFYGLDDEDIKNKMIYIFDIFDIFDILEDLTE